MTDSCSAIEISDETALPKAPVVSVYMLAYAHERFIAEAIEGVLAQQCDFPFELVIGEDCSPDATREIALDYQRRYPHVIRVLTGSANVGAFRNSERCITAAKGRFIAICEGDDFWHHPRKLAMQVEAFAADPDVTLCHTDYDRQLRTGLKRNLHRAGKSKHHAQGRAYEALLHDWTVMTVTAMYRADVLHAFLRSEFHERRWPFGDYNKALFAAVRGRISYLPVSTATWRKVDGSATNRDVDAYLNMAMAYSECRERFMAAYPVAEEVARSVRIDSRRRVRDRAFWAGRLDLFDEADRWLRDNYHKDDALLTRCRRVVLGNRALMYLTQLLRKHVRKWRMIPR